MAVYKVIQDVEAEDKLLGPLTFKGFIYILLAGALAFIEFRLFILGSTIKYALIFIFAIPMILFGVLGSPLGGDQPTEVWLLSRIRFFLKPRERIWDQDGIEELVTITAPKKIELHLTKEMDQTEVRSRLRALASTLDTRGWAIKNVNLNLNNVGVDLPSEASSDRLVINAGYSTNEPVIDIHASDDIMDEQNNPTAQKFAALMQSADENRKKDVLQTMKGLIDQTQVHPKVKKVHRKFVGDDAPDQKPKQKTSHPVHKNSLAPVTLQRQAVNMELAQSGNAFSVSTLSQLANRRPIVEQTGPNEVTISLH